MTDQAAERELFEQVDQFLAEELKTIQSEDPAVAHCMGMFSLPVRQAVLAIRRAQANVLNMMHRAGVDPRLVPMQVWVDEHLTADQGIAILAHSVGMTRADDKYLHRDPVTGERTEPDYSI